MYLEPRTMCPLFKSIQANEADMRYCKLDDKHGQAFINEFIGSFFFFFVFLIVRNYQCDTNDRGLTISNIIKPMIIAIIYKAAQSLGAPYLGGFKNPNLAFQMYFWNRYFYDYKMSTMTEQSEFERLQLDNYFWVYVSAPFAASVIAGIAAKLHLNALTKP